MGGEGEPTSPPPSARTRATAALLLWVPFALLAMRYVRLNPDDAFITMRYARNVLQGWGPVFNEGERVEGFTSPLQLVVAIATQVLPGGMDLLKLKLASLVFAALALVQAARLVDRCTPLTWARNLGRFLLGSSLIFTMNAATGMETALASLLITAFVVRFTDDAPRRHLLLGALALGCVLARPEASGIVAAAALLSAVAARRNGSWGSLTWAAIPTGGVVVMTIARLAYYGYPLPNTYEAKRLPLSRSIADGVEYLSTTWLPGVRWAPAELGAWVALGAAAASVAALVIGSAVVVLRRRDLALVPLAVASQVAFILMAGGDWIGRGRFLSPVILLVIALQVMGVAAASEVLGRVARPLRAIPSVALVLAALYAAGTGPLTPWRTLEDRWDDRTLMAAEGAIWAESAALLDCAEVGWTVADGEMGYGPWTKSDLRFIDTRGLVDERIARITPPDQRHTWGAGDPDFGPTPNAVALEVLRRSPELIILNRLDDRPGPLTEAYRPVGGWTNGTEERVAYLRRDLTCAS